MRNSLLFLALAGVGALSASAAADPAWQHAADQYVGAAQQEVGAYHKQVDAAPAGQSRRYADARSDLAQCDRLVDQLKSTDPEHFDGLKVQYEKTRARLVLDLRQAQGN